MAVPSRYLRLWDHLIRRACVATRFDRHDTTRSLRTVGLEQLVTNLAHARPFHPRQSPQIQPFNLLEKVLEFVRQKLRVIGAWWKMYVTADFSAAPCHDGKCAAARRDGGVDAHVDSHIGGTSNPLALSPERRRPVVDARHCPLEPARKLDIGRH